MFSRPIDRRTVPGATPALASSSSVSCEWVVEAGWMTRDLASPMLATTGRSCTPSAKARPASYPPLMTKESRPPVPSGAYFLPSS